MSGTENYRTTQAVLVIVIFCLFGVAIANFNWLITVGAVLAAAAVALYAATTQPAPTHNDHHH
jgi:predicted signal transduction protein with EAL and GGDEF domain